MMAKRIVVRVSRGRENVVDLCMPGPASLTPGVSEYAQLIMRIAAIEVALSLPDTL